MGIGTPPPSGDWIFGIVILVLGLAAVAALAYGIWWMV